jgi:hypothetical protein
MLPRYTVYNTVPATHFQLTSRANTDFNVTPAVVHFSDYGEEDFLLPLLGLHGETNGAED